MSGVRSRMDRITHEISAYRGLSSWSWIVSDSSAEAVVHCGGDFLTVAEIEVHGHDGGMTEDLLDLP